MTILTPGQDIRYYGTGKLAKRTAPATVVSVDGRMVTLKTTVNTFTVDIARIKR